MDQDEFAKMYELEDSHWWFLGKRRIARQIIGKYVTLGPGSRVLDVGCGTGGMLTVLAEHAAPFGIDISGIGLRFAAQRGRYPLLQASALCLPFADNSFDLVTGFDVLYHEAVSDDLVALNEFFRVCRPGGSLLLTDSALDILRSRHDEAYHALRRYTAAELSAKVTAAGFQMVKISYANAFLFPFVFAVRMWKRHFNGDERHRSDLAPAPPVVNSALAAVYGLEASLLPHVNFPLGSSVVCLARKPSVAAAAGRAGDARG